MLMRRKLLNITHVVDQSVTTRLIYDGVLMMLEYTNNTMDSSFFNTGVCTHYRAPNNFLPFYPSFIWMRGKHVCYYFAVG